MFQSFALFASISVAQDIAFGGEMQGMNRKSGGSSEREAVMMQKDRSLRQLLHLGCVSLQELPQTAIF
ncbi:hypothetical protein EMIT0P260_150136 [Pseudomonas sp. IT-P260]